MSFDKIIILIMAGFSIIGGLDRIFGNRLKLGTAFENGIKTMGELALSMIGIMVLAPVIADLLAPVVVPVYRFLGADPAMFAGTILACDMGGAPLAGELTSDQAAAQLGGLITGSMGILCGVVTVPIGVILGGLVAGFPLTMILLNTLPILVVSLLIALGLWKAEKQLIKGFEIFGKCITALATVGIVAAGVELTTGYTLIPGLASITEAFSVVGQIAIVLAGAFPLIAVLTKLLQKPFSLVGEKLRINSTSVSGLMATLANSLATFDMVKEMDPRGKIVNMAFAVSGAFVFGDHLAFTAGYDPAMIPALIVAKLSAGITAVILALLISKEKNNV